MTNYWLNFFFIYSDSNIYSITINAKFSLKAFKYFQAQKTLQIRTELVFMIVFLYAPLPPLESTTSVLEQDWVDFMSQQYILS